MQISHSLAEDYHSLQRDIPLRGIIKCGHCGCPMMPSYSKKKGVTYYYLCEKHEKGTSECPVKKVPAVDIPAYQQCKNGGIQQQDQMADKTGLRLQRL